MTENVSSFIFSCPPSSSAYQWRVRKEAMMGLASIYRKYSLQGEGGREASKQISWIKDKLLHIYYQNSIDDRFVCMFSCLFILKTAKSNGFQKVLV